MTDRLFELLDLMDSTDVRARIRQMLSELGSVAEADAGALEESVSISLHGIADSLRDVCVDDDTTEARAMLPWIWLELQFEWMRYNLQIQYQTILRGTAESVLMARGATLSYVLEELKFHLDAESASVVDKIAADSSAAAMSWKHCALPSIRSGSTRIRFLRVTK
ncbi:hypothetical protein [Gemmatimonas sp.]|uniref:hypothetical protein n=1 Tax=Gemmatimonas sp. TaxID=1962908 RepID=UPI00356858D5